MAKPLGWDSAAHSSSNNTSSGEDHLWSWFADEGNYSARDSRVQSHISFDTNSPDNARARAVDEVLKSKRDGIRQARLNDEPNYRDAAVKPVAPADSFLTNLELTNNKPNTTEVRAEKKVAEPATVAETRDLGFASIRQLEGPNSASSRWMAANRPDLIEGFKSQDCSLQIGSKPDGTVFEVLTSPQGFSRMLTAKGSTTVEIIADRNGNELFKASGRGTTTRDSLSA
jgi:hypothetical protein